MIFFENDFDLGCGQEGGGGGGASDCCQYNDAVPSQQTPNKEGGPPLLHPFVGKQANLKGPVQMKQGKNINVQRGNKRYDITYNPATDFTEPPLFTKIPTSQPMVTGKFHSKRLPLTKWSVVYSCGRDKI
ncbi:hypothetical protein OS493_025261 [Desmophyllum pertusum]|uniref:Uncharacterized protein n=1 Tax=Desmophyllum pertusum TaxID=174260 RepID=A0A9W9ZAK2_9CNID|nr:hypothetical protein OS493_025261 [Desmophyllum pertusum]